jgi:hypothetical protein
MLNKVFNNTPKKSIKNLDISFWTCLFITVFYICTYNLFRFWAGSTPFLQDVDQYYSYLIALFIENDLTFQFKNSYWLNKTDLGLYVPKVSIGMSIVYLPGYLIGDLVAKLTNTPRTGYSWPYIWGVYYCSIFYAIIGFWKLRSILKKYVSNTSTALTLLSISLGTNYLYYVLSWGEMPHNYLFVIYTFMIDQIIKFHKTKQNKNLYIISFLSAIIILIRPAEIVFFIFPLLYNIYSKETFKQKIELIKSISWHWIIVFLIFTITISPQLIYWKCMTGKIIYFSYGSNERFFFNNPQILNFLISFKKGWLIYSPIMIFSVIGLFFIKKYFKEITLSLPIFLIVTVYFLSSWWSWWYGGSYGNRAMIQYYTFLALPLAMFYEKIFTKKIIIITGTIMILCLISFNIFQIKLYNSALLHWDSMSRKSYFYLLQHNRNNNFDVVYYNKLLKAPDYEAAAKGKYVYKWYE